MDVSGSVSAASWQFQRAFSGMYGSHSSMETSVVAHAPGFTLLENAYWKNHTWYFVTSRPWAFPELPMVMTNAPDYDEPALFDDGVAKLVSLNEAELIGLDFNDVVAVEVYHLVGEMFLGAWRVYTSVLANPFDVKSQWIIQRVNTKSVLDQVPPINRFIFNHAPPDKVYDHGRLNKFFFDTVFPRIPLEFEDAWQERAESLKLFRFDMVTIADRWSGHRGHSPKPMDRAFQLPVPTNWVNDLKKRLLVDYRGPVSLKDPSHAKSKPVITYLSRQEAIHRRLRPEVHEELSAGLKVLEEEGLAEVNIEMFVDSDPKYDQVAKLSRTTIFVALHGNGLTNLIYMTPDAYGRSAVYEIQQPGMFFDDYPILSKAVGTEHWIIGGRDPALE
ncbi:hypothetical protein QFC22_003658 [Naganishia vaughanmartiniae]|uniref:Uncharacterized protein n=1 Tax=Naganishia vaughanmartiniae TaxID=1424756 RepID=A0ACC2X687_9TREE|nr:hypothetical protein QFC22_003658 [Naganishia vaughanmartiniae]